MLRRLLSLVAVLALACSSAHAYAPERTLLHPSELASPTKTAHRGFAAAAETTPSKKSPVTNCRIRENWFPPLNLTSSIGFTGYYADQESQSYYAQQRYYRPGVGRFNRIDPWQGDTNNPITLNKYLYANGNPLIYVDPDGRAAHPCTAEAGGCITPEQRQVFVANEARELRRSGEERMASMPPRAVAELENPPAQPVEGPVISAPYSGPPPTGFDATAAQSNLLREQSRQNSAALERRAGNAVSVFAGPFAERDPNSVTGRQFVNLFDGEPISASEQYDAIGDGLAVATLMLGPKLIGSQSAVAAEGSGGSVVLRPTAPPARYKIDPNTQMTIEAEGVVSGFHRGRAKAKLPDPVGGLRSGDHRGHLIPEGGVDNPSLVNVPQNLISESPASNLGLKKSVDYQVSKLAAQFPQSEVTIRAVPLRAQGQTRPFAVTYEVRKDGEIVKAVTILNPP